MKIKIMLLFAIVSVLAAITLSPALNETVEVEPALALANRVTYKVYMDSIGIALHRHIAKTAQHEKADAVTDSSTGTAGNLKSAIAYALNIRTNLSHHFLSDSCHQGTGDNVTVLPTAIPLTATYAQYKNFVDSLRLSMNAHLGRTISTRYKLMGKDFTAKFIAHAGDTGAHIVADETFNTVTFDSTNIDSVNAGWNRLKSRWNGHIQLANADSASSPHWAYTNLDSITSPDATNYATLYALVDELYTKHKLHFARVAVHKAADTDTVTTAAVVSGKGHIAADTKTYTAHTGGHISYNLPYFNRLILQYTGSSVTTGGSFRYYKSIDGQDWQYLDSVSVTANGALIVDSLKWYPYFKVYLNKRTDGTYKIQFKGVK